MQPQTTTMIVGVIGIAGTLSSGVIGQLMARSAQRKHWELDRKTEEFRELLDALTIAYLDACERAHLASIGLAITDESHDEILPTAQEMTAYRILRNRLFTASELEAEDVTRRWDTALINFKKNGEIEKFAARFTSIFATVVWLSTGKGNRPKHI